MADEAITLALRRLVDPGHAPVRRRLTSELVVRGSTAHHAAPSG
jgi:DNA-binding LacI/PurR family transcriptional regulator